MAKPGQLSIYVLMHRVKTTRDIGFEIDLCVLMYIMPLKGQGKFHPDDDTNIGFWAADYPFVSPMTKYVTDIHLRYSWARRVYSSVLSWLNSIETKKKQLI